MIRLARPCDRPQRSQAGSAAFSTILAICSRPQAWKRIADLALLDDLDAQIGQAQTRIAALLPTTEYAVLTSVPGWGSVCGSGPDNHERWWHAEGHGRPDQTPFRL
jgi:hypothetical protein